MSNVHTLTLTGMIDRSDLRRIGCDCRAVEEFAAGSITIVDMTDVTYFDTTLIRALNDLHSRITAHLPTSSILVAAPEQSFARRIFDILRLELTMPIFEHLSAARECAAKQHASASRRWDRATPLAESTHDVDI